MIYTIESPRFTRQCEELGVAIQRLDEARETVSWAVEHDPEAYELVEGTNLRVARIGAMGDIPALRINYSNQVDDDGEDFVLWENIEVISDDPDEPVND